MKLPENRNDRIKILVLIFAGGAGVLFAAVQLGILPLLAMQREKIARTEELRAACADAEMKVKAMERDRENKAADVREISELSDKYVLRRRLGNLLLSATEILEAQAAAAGVSLESVREAGVSEIPEGAAAGAKKKGPVVPKGRFQTFKLYTAHAVLDCGLMSLSRLMDGLEKSNPFLCVSSVTIIGKPETPLKHRVEFDVQWPIWTDPDLLAELQETPEVAAGPEPVKDATAGGDQPPAAPPPPPAPAPAPEPQGGAQ